MLHLIPEQDLINACKTLFDVGDNISTDFLKKLHPKDLKAAYRTKALQTHPDRARVIGNLEYKMTEQFKDVAFAYSTLNSVIQNPHFYFSAIERRSQCRGKRKDTPLPNKSDSFFEHLSHANLPRHKLRTGQFLYYHGLVSWRDLIMAIVWQRAQRPRLGQIANEWGILSLSDISKILRQRVEERRCNLKFGEYAYHRGYITSFQLLALLGKQRRLQPLIGTYFVEQGILTARKVEKMVEKLKAHNSRSFHMG